jgi:hypothetical protein
VSKLGRRRLDESTGYYVVAKKLALELAASVNGVRGVVDRLRVAPGERRGDGAVRDSVAGRSSPSGA